jgi:PAS domain S-box-containing protein
VGVDAQRPAQVQDALYRIAELASSAQDMPEFYRAIHEIVGELMYARNIYIALYDEERQLINWAYDVDEIDEGRPDPSQWLAFDDAAARGTTGYVLRTGEPQHLSGERIAELAESGEIELHGELSEDWLGVPLKSAEGRTVGVLVLQSYTKGVGYTDEDKDLLAFVGQHVGAALSRARAIEETRQRNAELAVINSVQEALAGELEMQAIYDVVGDKIQEIFDAQVVDICTYDRAANVVHFQYSIERGKRTSWEPYPLESLGFMRVLIETGEPLRVDDSAEARERLGVSLVTDVEPRSSLMVPLLTGGAVSGLISLQNMDREHAFDEADQRLLTTLASSLSVALENARLVSETRQRNAELALINSVQSALAGELKMQAIYDVVGDKIDEIFDAQGVSISMVDEATGLVGFPYLIERGERLRPEPIPLGSGFTAHVLETCEPLLINEDLAAEAERHGSFVVAGEMEKSAVFVPLVTGRRANGVIVLSNFDREHAFTDADVRLLTTFASSLSVALENARLVHETRQRNAELAVINDVQDALAGELELQAIYGAVGDRIGEIFDVQSVSIAITDESTGNLEFPYAIELGTRHDYEIAGMAPYGFRKHVLETGESLRFNQDVEGEAERFDNPVIVGEMPKSILFVPLAGGGRTTGVIDLQNINREQAFSESDEQLLETLAGSLSVALENARLVHETRQRNAELGLINSVQDALAGELELQAIYEAVGERIRDVFDAQVVDIAIYNQRTGLLDFPYIIERGERIAQDPIPVIGFRKHVMEAREALVIDEPTPEIFERYGNPRVLQGATTQAGLFVPLLVGGRATGVISLQNIDRTHAFDDDDQRLLTTLAGSLSVALENARLVHETRQRNAELALINGVQEAIAGELDQQAIYDAVGDEIRTIFDAQAIVISMLDEPTGLFHDQYAFELGERLEGEPWLPIGFSKHVLETRESLLIAENTEAARERYGSEVSAGEAAKSVLFVPLVSGGRATGVISLQNIDREHAFSESDQQLLETLAGSLSVALENARLVHETRQRNAELALINSVQDAIAGELDQQAIYDAVGDKIQEIFDAQSVRIDRFDRATGLLHYPYLIELGERLQVDPQPPAGFAAHVLETCETVLINENVLAEAERYGSTILAGEAPKSVLFVALVAGGNATGLISLQNIDREHAFGESDVQLLETLAGSLSVALENARLVHETRQRNAELALINSVQDAIAGELDTQAIYDAVGDEIQEIFDAQIVQIVTLDDTTGLANYPYVIERGERLEVEPREPIGFSRHVLGTREPLLLTENLEEESERYGSFTIAGEAPKSVLFVPLVSGRRATGVISLQNSDREHAFGDSDQQLLETLAGSLSVALENARLVQETRQRNAELALINGVQDAIAGELDTQAIYDAVGDRIQEIFDAQAVQIVRLDEPTGLMNYPYVLETGKRHQVEPRVPAGFSKHVLETREPLLIVENVDAEAERYGSVVIAGESPKSVLFVPLVSGGKSTGVVSLQNVDREHAFGQSDQQLLETLAGSLSVALENARLVHETRQRNAELALINGVQDAIAGELDSQAIYDAVGNRIRDVFDAQTVTIATVDETAGSMQFPYIIERGQRLEQDPIAVAGFTKHVLETREPLLITENLEVERARYHSEVIAEGEAPKSVLFVPLVAGGQATGVISLQNVDREHAFEESDQQLLMTLAGSLSVALENARLVHETRQRNAELALINSVQDAIAGELDAQAIYTAVGDRVRDVFDAQVVSIRIYDAATGLLHFPYIMERGERLYAEPNTPVGFAKHVLDTRRPLLIGENMDVEAERFGSTVIAGERPKSALLVPILIGGRTTGVISLQNIDREHAFDEADQQLLTTVAGSVSVALENARLVQETRQRNTELAVINSVQEAIAGELEPQAIYDAVGDRIQNVFDAQTVIIATLDAATGLTHFPYFIERGDRLQAEPTPLSGFTKHVLETREPLLVVENLEAEAEEYGSTVLAGEAPKSVLFVPLVAGGKATGAISLQNVDREHAFDEADQQLLTTVAGSLSVALENARLVEETRLRVAELATVNSVGQALSSQLDLDALIQLVGEQVRETFDADVAYVALHNRSTGLIDFPYYYDALDPSDQPPMAYGEGLTSQIIESREVLLLNRSPQFEEHEGTNVGTPVRSFLGVPILLRDSAIGVISVQNIEEEGRFGEADVRLLTTIAANVGVAIQNARLFREVERQRQYLESLVTISPAAVVVLDTDERVTEWNPAAAELFGYSAEEAVGQPVDELVLGEEEREEGREITREAMAIGRAQRITRRRRKDGTLVDVELMLVPLTSESAHVGFLGIYHDVTELQRAREEAEAATQAKSAFLATMSHEIRTPMNAVIGMTDLLLGTELTGEQREFAEVVHSSGDALLHVIDDILDYSKIEAGKLDLEHEPFNLRDCVEGALDIVAPRAWEKELELGCLIDDDAPAGIVGDEARLRQVLLNLLSNAVKFTERGEVVVLVDAEETKNGKYKVELAVRDTGIGIPPDRMDMLFTSFSQVDASTTRRFGGTGLGLAISKRLIELMGGAISVESEEKKGSTFRISLPVTAADVPTRFALDEGLPHLAGKRILIVDDNATNREIVTRHARSWEMEPVAVELPAAALELIAKGEPFDIAVLDMMMPDMDGLALAGAIREHRSEEELPLLLLTSLGRLPTLQTGGVFSAQLAKPLKASQLYNTLLQLLTAGRAGEEEVETVTDGKRTRSALRILLAEDNAMNQKVALRLLEQLGYRADVASNGREAIEALERQPYDVVLMDVQMPELDGLDATRQIVERWPEETRPHIVAMTANALPEDREACFAAGMNDYVAKPIRAEELVAALKRAKPLAGGDGDSAPLGYVSLEDDALKNLRDLGGDEFLGEVIDAFLADAPELIATLRRSLDESNNEELRRAAHTLKSNGATLGAAQFAELCRTLEHQAKSGELDGAPELVDQIEQEYAPLEEALTALRSETPA